MNMFCDFGLTTPIIPQFFTSSSYSFVIVFNMRPLAAKITYCAFIIIYSPGWSDGSQIEPERPSLLVVWRLMKLIIIY